MRLSPRILISALAIALIGGLTIQSTFAAEPPAAARKKSDLPISRETTHFLGPIDADGYIDYAAALDERSRGKTTTADNALAAIWNAYGPYGSFSSRDLPPPHYFTALGIAPPRPDGDYLISERNYLEAFDAALRPKLWDDFTATSQRIWTAHEFPIIFGWFERNNAALDRAVEATKKPRFYRPIVRKTSDGEFILALMPHEMMMIRPMSGHLAGRAHYRMGERRFDAAWSDLLAMRRLARLVATSPTLLDVLVGYSIDADARRAEINFLETTDLDHAALRRYLADLKALPPLPSQADAFHIGERAYLLDSIQQTSRGNFKFLNVLEGPLTEENRRAISRTDFTQAMRAANRWFDRATAALRLPNATARLAELKRMEDERERINRKFLDRLKIDPKKDDYEYRRIDGLRDGELSDFLLSSDTLLPPLLYRAHDEHQQLFALSKIGLALAAYRVEQHRFPDKLDDLRPQYFTSLPTDLYAADAPLRYRLEPDGYTLYSVGPNGKDDRGENNRRDADAEVRTDDFVLRIRLPAD